MPIGQVRTLYNMCGNFPNLSSSSSLGYFTSRPSLKVAIKKGTNLLHSSNQLNVLSLQGINHAGTFQEMRETLGILQHHDAITGTCKQYVNDDYQRMLSLASESTEAAILSSYLTLTQVKMAPGQSKLGFCSQLNISQCQYTEYIDNQMDSVISIYNPIAHPLRHFVRLPVKDMQFVITDHFGQLIESQLVPIHPKIGSLKERSSLATHELIFLSTLDPLGISSYSITKSNGLIYFFLFIIKLFNLFNLFFHTYNNNNNKKVMVHRTFPKRFSAIVKIFYYIMERWEL